MANMPFVWVLYGVRRQAAAKKVPAVRAASSTQQPLQIFFSREFTRASSALIESTYLAVPAFEAGTFRNAGFEAASGVALS
jgi:hypothetical protein